jgi:protein arginine kinase
VAKTKRNDIEALLNHKVNWLDSSGPDSDIAISSRIRLARNIANMPFPIVASKHDKMQVAAAVENAIEQSDSLGSSFLSYDIEKLSEIDRQILLERRLVSREFIANRGGELLVVKNDESCGVMVNEEDHLRIQVLAPGLQLEHVWKIINELDNRLSGSLPYAFDEQLGFLTSCPTNVGTGLRASVMLHLPALRLSGQINAAIQGISKLGLAVRGIFGEGSDNLGNLFQISNQSTMGETEQQIIFRLSKVIRQVINHEKNSRASLMKNKRYFLLDHVGRAYGTLRRSYILSSAEALDSLSALRTGVDLGMFSSVDMRQVNELFKIIHSAHLQRFAGKALTHEERDIFRAKIVRDMLAEKNDKET